MLIVSATREAEIRGLLKLGNLGQQDPQKKKGGEQRKKEPSVLAHTCSPHSEGVKGKNQKFRVILSYIENP